MRYYDFFDSPHGRMLIVAGEDALTGIYFEGQKYHPALEPHWRLDPGHAPLRQAARELAEYFSGERTQFETPVAPEGTPFQQGVWKAISTVPFGSTLTYGELARRAGFSGSARAAGAATGRNPLTIVVPCHRIVGAGGSLTGYAGGLNRKRALLQLEGARREPTRPASMVDAATSSECAA